MNHPFEKLQNIVLPSKSLTFLQEYSPSST